MVSTEVIDIKVPGMNFWWHIIAHNDRRGIMVNTNTLYGGESFGRYHIVEMDDDFPVIESFDTYQEAWERL